MSLRPRRVSQRPEAISTPAPEPTTKKPKLTAKDRAELKRFYETTHPPRPEASR